MRSFRKITGGKSNEIKTNAGRARFVALAVSASVLASTAFAEPPRFEVRDEDSTLTLLGTVHILRPETRWRDPGLDRALAAAEEIWFEIRPGSDKDPQIQQKVQQFGLDPATPLDRKLDPAEYAKFKAAAASLGLQAARLNALRPWFAALTLTVATAQKAGFEPDSGVEKVLERETGKRPVKAFETTAEQLSFFAGLAPEIEKALLLEAIDQVASGAGRLDELVKLWQAGDLEGLDRLVNLDLKRDYPALHDVLLRQRNAAWVERIKAEMAGAGKDFIAVGAGHLVGADGVPELLRKAGFTVVQVSVSAPPKAIKPARKAAKPTKR